MQTFSESELIINPDGSIYHLNLKPEDIAHTVLFVGDPDRVDKITQHFDEIVFETQKREFKTVTGYYKTKKISVLSTGIGTDNIDIVLNELDALVNIDFKTRQLKKETISLDIIRIGTSGSIQKDIPVDSFLMSTHAIGTDGLLFHYKNNDIVDKNWSEAFISHTNWSSNKPTPYLISGSDALINTFNSDQIIKGITQTANGFYGPQGRSIRAKLHDEHLKDKISSFKYNNARVTNLEMETAGIYTLCRLLNHNACSLNAILANRATGVFSENPEKTIEELILYTLNTISGR